MKGHIKLCTLFLTVITFVVLCCLTCPSHAKARNGGRTFFVDANKGNDNFGGTSSRQAWKTLEKVNRTIFLPGDVILFKRGCNWKGQLFPKGSGTMGKIITIDSYGTGALPLIAGYGVTEGALHLYNQACWMIKNLEITNYNPAEENGISLKTWESRNEENFIKPELPPQLKNQHKPKHGVYIEARDTGMIASIYLINLHVHGVNGYINQADELSKQNGGIYFVITGTQVPTYFKDILIQGCNIHDVDRSGIILVNSTWKDRTLITNKNWVPSLNIRVKNNRFKATGANALIVRIALKPIIEHNLFDLCAIKASGNAAFSFNCDSALWQYNECKRTKANIDDHDAGGIDADYRSKYTIIQYNYVHDNDYGILITGGPGEFNDSTQIRYNLFERDGRYPHPKNGKSLLRVSGSATHTLIYNNVFFIAASQKDTRFFSHETWRTAPSSTYYFNNIIYNEGANTTYNWGTSTQNILERNLFYTTAEMLIPKDVNQVSGEVMFVKTGAGPEGYRIKKGSAAIKAGRNVKGHPKTDFFKNPVTETQPPNLGIYNGPPLP